MSPSAIASGPGQFHRDGRILSTPSYVGDRRDGDVVKGGLAPPAQMIEYEAAVAEPAAIEEPEPPATAPESAAARYEREGIDAGSAIASSTIRSPRVCSVVS